MSGWWVVALGYLLVGLVWGVLVLRVAGHRRHPR